MCLNEGIELQKNEIVEGEEQTYKIISALKAEAKYDEVERSIDIKVIHTEYGIKEILDTDGTILNTNSLTANKKIEKEGDYVFTVIDNNQNEIKLKVKVRFPFFANGVTANMYGAEVKGYVCPVSEELKGTENEMKWRIFYADETNIYLIADDFVPNANLPATSTEAIVSGTELNKRGTYYANFADIVGCYSGSDWIINNRKAKKVADKWIKWVNKYPDSTNNNIKAVAYMIDTLAWSKFAGENAEYAIGGPTFEMYCKSYSKTHEIGIECEQMDENGYQLKWSNGSYTNYLTNVPVVKELNNIYMNDTTKARGYWIASPHYQSIYVGATDYTLKYLSGYYYYDYYTDFGFRPVVCLSSDVQLKELSNKVYGIQ